MDHKRGSKLLSKGSRPSSSGCGVRISYILNKKQDSPRNDNYFQYSCVPRKLGFLAKKIGNSNCVRDEESSGEFSPYRKMDYSVAYITAQFTGTATTKIQLRLQWAGHQIHRGEDDTTRKVYKGNIICGGKRRSDRLCIRWCDGVDQDGRHLLWRSVWYISAQNRDEQR